MAAKVLVIDDQESQRNILAEILIAEGQMEVFQAGNVDDALDLIRKNTPEVVLTDLKMPGKSGLSLMEEIVRLPLPPEVIFITAFGSIETAIKATRLGAYDYINKPVNPEKVLFLIEKAREKYLLKKESGQLKQELTREVSSNLVAQSEIMKQVLSIIDTVAKTDSTVLIRGETGTGKECVARLIHLKSPRALHPIRSINCSAVAETLLDSELFGYEKNAFTGAVSRKAGIVESVSGGTLFLDEVGDMSPSTQAKVLRTLQERTIRRVGGNEDIKVDIRIIAATNKDLESAMKDGSFRQDLFYRLNVVPVFIPPLRERKEDIPVLISRFFSKYGQEREIDPSALKSLMDYKWPGNVRELESAIERLAIFSKNPVISMDDLNEHFNRSLTIESTYAPDLPDEGIIFEDLERRMIAKALEKSNGNMVAAAKLLGMSYRAFRYRTMAFGFKKK